MLNIAKYKTMKLFNNKKVNKTTGSIKTISKNVGSDIKGLKKLPWSQLPLKGVICLVVPLILIFALIFMF